jgi:hypothetical protein
MSTLKKEIKFKDNLEMYAKRCGVTICSDEFYEMMISEDDLLNDNLFSEEFIEENYFQEEYLERLNIAKDDLIMDFDKNYTILKNASQKYISNIDNISEIILKDYSIVNCYI